MINSTQMFDIVKKIFNKNEINHLAESLVIKSDIGYELYNKYSITKRNEKFTVRKFNTHVNKSFYSLRNAVIWTTFDKKDYIVDSEIIVKLDIKLESLDTNIQLYKNLCNKSKNYDSKIIYFTKLDENKLERQYILGRIESYSQQVKNLQNKMYMEAIK